MKVWSKATLAVIAMSAIGLSGIRLLGQAATQDKGATKGKAATQSKAQAKAGQAKSVAGTTAAEFFNNVTTPTLGALTPADFILAMGVLTDDLGLDCADCHPGAGSDKANFVIDTPQKRTARKMIE